MYVPAHFSQTDHDEIVRFVAAHGFATLCSVDEEGVPFASHVPLLVADPTPGRIVLEGHVARANGQWRHADGKAVVAIFSGPHHYISPTWYGESGTVPTWNYLAVHATGIFHALHDADSLRRIVSRAVEVYEAGRPSPWRPDVGVVEPLLAGIVGFRVEVTRLDAKGKLNQNHPPERRERVIRAWEAEGGEDARAIAEAMRRHP
jgi:transcriptional regulator